MSSGRADGSGWGVEAGRRDGDERAPGRTGGGRNLRLDDVDVYRRGLHLIDRLSLDVPPGQVLGVSGPSGAGKTTLLRVIAGMTRNYSGRVHLPEGRMSFVFQEPRLLPWLTARKNVQLTLPPESIGKMFIAEEWLERVGLDGAMELYPAQMSGGMRQRVSIARAMATGPRLLLVDEPFSALDKPLALALREDLRDIIAHSDLVTVWVSHDPGELDEVSALRLHLDGPPGGRWRLQAQGRDGPPGRNHPSADGSRT
ncbi:MAG: ATP-binding cassette domain-containing protein [Actinomycetaceae bacterium]|nr:ATP-binding cassette domain-containing protein [Actinomycetaceae bacterium]